MSTPETRKIYDQYGHEGLERHKQTGGRGAQHDPFDLFSRFFGGSGHFGHGSGVRRGQNKEARIALPLRDFYNGVEREFTLDKQVVCSSCEGSGSKDGVVDTCGSCGGTGMRIQKHMLAPGIFQQVQSVCGDCGGKGKKVRNACPVCNGHRVVREPEKFTLHVERGMPNGVRVTYENEADESPDWEAGDLIVEVSESDAKLNEGAEDPIERTDGTFFRRRGNDLFWREVLSLREAWMGDWTRNLTHLDGHTVRLSRPRGSVVQPGTLESVAGEGMPIWKEGEESTEYGALNVEYVIILPDQMDKGMEKEFWGVWEKWRLKKAVNLLKDSGRPDPIERVRDEL